MKIWKNYINITFIPKGTGYVPDVEGFMVQKYKYNTLNA